MLYHANDYIPVGRQIYGDVPRARLFRCKGPAIRPDGQNKVLLLKKDKVSNLDWPMIGFHRLP